MIEEFTHETFEAPFLDDYLKVFLEHKEKHEGFKTHYIKRDEAIVTGTAMLEGILKNTNNFGKHVCGQQAPANKEYFVSLDELKPLSDFDPRFMMVLFKRFPKCSIQKSGHFYYPPNTGMDWHTNADQSYLRCYINYSKNGDSYFKYYDQVKKETVYDNDSAGWNIRTFRIEKDSDKLFWHSVYSKTDRLSIGFKVINNLK